MTRQSAEVYLGEGLSATGDFVDDMRENPQVLYPAGIGKLASQSLRRGQPLLHGGGKKRAGPARCSAPGGRVGNGPLDPNSWNRAAGVYVVRTKTARTMDANPWQLMRSRAVRNHDVNGGVVEPD